MCKHHNIDGCYLRFYHAHCTPSTCKIGEKHEWHVMNIHDLTEIVNFELKIMPLSKIVMSYL